MRTIQHTERQRYGCRTSLLSKECDIIESSHDWEKEYGNLNEQEMLASIVYE